MVATAKPSSKTTAYDRLKDSARQRNATLSAAGRDIGPIARVANSRRKNACKFDLRRFCLTYGNHDPEPKFTLPFGADHLKAIEILQRCVLEGGVFAFAMPRGWGKSTISVYTILWALAYGHKRFAMLVAANAAKAAERMEDLQASLLENDLLAADFPETIQAIRHIEGDNRRSNGQTFNGKRTKIRWSSDEIVFADVAKSPAARSICMIAGIESSSIRGTNRKGRRPDFVLLDDPQTDESAASPKQCFDREQVIEGAILGMEGPRADLSAAMPCTVIRKGDLADRFLDPKIKPRWQGLRAKMVYRMPDALARWDEYKALRDRSMLEHGDGQLATAFYIANRAELDAGAVLSWPERKKKTQASGLQFAMDLYFENPYVFAAEYQNDPIDRDTQSLPVLTDFEIERKTDEFVQGTCETETQKIVAHVDVQMDLLYWTVMAVGGGFRCQVIDYGTWPKIPRRYFTYSAERSRYSYQDERLGFEGSLHRALNGDGSEKHPGLLNVLAEKEYEKGGDMLLRLNRGLIDIGNWDVEILNALRQNTHRNVWTAAKGHSGRSATGLTMMQWPKKDGDGNRGQYWILGKAKAGRYQLERVLFGTNFWKSQLADRLRTPLGVPGCLTLYKGGHHKMFAENLTAERPREETLKDGGSWIVWKLIENRDNHFLDNAVGCLVAASMEGIALPNLGHEDAYGNKQKKRRVPRFEPLSI